MTSFLFSNNATATLAEAISATSTTINLATGTGSLFPSPGSGEAFAVTLTDAATGLSNEICYCTARSGDQLTVTRAQESTTALAWSAGDNCSNLITAGVIGTWLSEGVADSLYVSQASGSLDFAVTTAGVRKDTGLAWVEYTDASGDSQYIFLQPSGSYATTSQLSTETTARQTADTTLSNSIAAVRSSLNQANCGQSGQNIDTTTTGSSSIVINFTPSVSGVVFLSGSFMPSTMLNVSGSLSTACTLSVSGYNPQGSQTRLTQNLMICVGLNANTAYTFTFTVQVNTATPGSAGQATMGYIFTPHAS